MRKCNASSQITANRVKETLELYSKKQVLGNWQNGFIQALLQQEKETSV